MTSWMAWLPRGCRGYRASVDLLPPLWSFLLPLVGCGLSSVLWEVHVLPLTFTSMLLTYSRTVWVLPSQNASVLLLAEGAVLIT